MYAVFFKEAFPLPLVTVATRNAKKQTLDPSVVITARFQPDQIRTMLYSSDST